MAGGRLAIGLAGDEAECLRIDPFAGAGRVLIAGPPRSGRSTVLRSLARQAVAAGVPTVIAAPARSPLTRAARELGLAVIGPDDAAPPPPPARSLVLVDDGETFTDAPAGDRLTGWLRDPVTAPAMIVAGRSEDLATTYRGVAAEVRRSRCGILLRPGPVDGELLGVRLPRSSAPAPPGRGVAVGEPAWGRLFEAGEPVAVQVAVP
jgi:S-DNA-T family DNA segregation ATPase FtsK/SpoIIIE